LLAPRCICLALHLFVFDEVGIGELAEKALDFVFEDGRAFLDNVLDVFKHDVLCLNRREGNHGYDRGSKLLYQVLDEVIVGQEVEVAHNQPDGTENHSWINVAETGNHAVDDPE
jgi:hypothetical protein